MMDGIGPGKGAEIVDAEKSAALQDDVAAPPRQRGARASRPAIGKAANLADHRPTKRRKTRRGKPNKRRHPYEHDRKSQKGQKVVKPEAPYNSNQFLLEDHGGIEELDENIRHPDRTSCRTRDSSFSVDSDGEFYSSPDDEEQFLIKDFVDQYESVQAERLQSLSKDELIQEYLLLEGKVEFLTKRLRKRGQLDPADGGGDLQKEIERLTAENESLRRENAALLRGKTCTSDSADSETDSDDSCSSTSSSSGSSSQNSPKTDYSKTNGHSSSKTGVETV